ncbi:MAG: DUF2149 domain-containing protein [Oscillospiraceae bacterium]|nr:DUF2149 domain-containing protein [Oscillospiraceae bacterium]
MRRKRIDSGSSPAAFQEDVNPMDGVGNLADAMLVLAVGIMLALVVAWNVDITTSTPATDSDNSAAVDPVYEVDGVLIGGDEEDAESIDMDDLSEYDGKVYVDSDGNFYFAEDGE